MAFVQFTRVSLAFGDRDLLNGVSLFLAAGSRAALTGANGSGKSTLMKVIAGKLEADSGDRAVQKGSRVSYLPQSGLVHRGKSLREEAEAAYEPVINMISAMEECGRALEDSKSDGGKTAVLLEEYHRLQEAVEDSGYYRREAEITAVLGGLGFAPEDLHRDAGEFSGGWQMRIALAKVLLERPGILLLDEPTNYLDIEARGWLEGWLQSFSGGYLLVSHDRYFLDATVNEVYELFQGDLKRYMGNYSAYENIRAVEMESLLKRYAAQQEEIAKTESLIRRFRYKASKAAFAQELIKRLEKMERIEIPESLKKINIALPPPPHAGKIALTLEGIGKCYGARRVLGGAGRGVDILVESRERLLVVGRNGAGKSTLLRIIAGEDKDFEGTVRYGAGISPGYFSQDAAETLTGEETVLEFMEAQAPTALIPRLRDMLGAFLFRGDDVYKSVSVLSGGEKSRLALLRMLLKPMNLLILDEPTNHLDLQAKDILLDTLKAYEGTVIFVSHDRSFMEALSTKTLELSGGSPRLFYGDYAYYLDRLNREAAGMQQQQQAPAEIRPEPRVDHHADHPVDMQPEQNAEAPEPDTMAPIILLKANCGLPTDNAAEYREAAKQRQTLIRRLERQEAEILKALEEMETEKAALEKELARPAVYTNGEKARTVQAKLRGITAVIDAKTAEWEQKAAELQTASGDTA
ncbi:ABC transporter ATP-binding protein [Spirochaetia bacterium]|nr:ABC transporter ATP-binding protein [Spirochaetia bacterium]